MDRQIRRQSDSVKKALNSTTIQLNHSQLWEALREDLAA
jgi:hypothetical protein